MFQGLHKPADKGTPAPKRGTPLGESFFRAVGRTLKCRKLGTLLVESGLVTKAELARALAIQKETGEQLGRILIREGAIEALQLYRQLAQQWCLKASAAGVAMMMMAPHEAQAGETSLAPQFQMAAASINPSALRPSAKTQEQQAEYPALFGTAEVRSSDISAFKKWTGVMARFEAQIKTQASTNHIMMWKAALQDMKGLSTREKIESVNNYVNQVRYVEDKNNYGKSDYWATPAEFFSRGGDCEDFAIAKYASLRALGFSSGQLRIAIVQDTVKRIAHAILIVYAEGEVYVLDNQDKRLKTAASVTRYEPIFSINSSSWWLHKRAVS